MTSKNYSIIERPSEAGKLDEGFEPFGGAAELWLNQSPEVIIIGPAETGKTRGALEKLNALAWKYPGAQLAMVRKRYADLLGSCLQTFELKVLGYRPDETTPVVKYGGERPLFYDYPNGSRIWLGGLDKPGKIMSSERDFIYINQCEEIELGDYETIITRATGRAGNSPYAQVFGDANPTICEHWLYEREREGRLKLIQSKHEHNPVLFDQTSGEQTRQGKATLKVLDGLTGVRYIRLRLGKCASVEGQVWDYDQATHLIDRFEIPAEWPRYRCIDFGTVHPFVCGWFTTDGDGRLYLYRYMYMTGRTVTTHAKQILKVTRDEFEPAFKAEFLSDDRFYTEHGNLRHRGRAALDQRAKARIETTICDHDADGRLTLKGLGIPNKPALKDVLGGIDKVNDRFAISPVDGKARLYILKDSLVEVDRSLEIARKPYTVEGELPFYVWANTQAEAPVKRDDDSSDMLRYMVMYLDGKPKKQKAFRVAI